MSKGNRKQPKGTVRPGFTVAIPQKAIPMDDLLKIATAYCDEYKKLGNADHKEVYLRIADFMRFMEKSLNKETAELLAAAKSFIEEREKDAVRTKVD